MSEARGEYNRRVEIQRRVGTGSLNQPSETWETFKSPWCKIRTQSGMSVAKAMDINGVVDAPKLYSIRLLELHRDITEANRVKLGDVVYAIKTVRLDEANREYTDIVCEVGQNRG